MHACIVCIVPNYYFIYGVSYLSFPAFSSPAFSTLCNFVPHFPVLHFHVLHFRATFSSLAFSTPCRFVPHSPVLHFHVSHFQRPRHTAPTVHMAKSTAMKLFVHFNSTVVRIFVLCVYMGVNWRLFFIAEKAYVLNLAHLCIPGVVSTDLYCDYRSHM